MRQMGNGRRIRRVAICMAAGLTISGSAGLILSGEIPGRHGMDPDPAVIADSSVARLGAALRASDQGPDRTHSNPGTATLVGEAVDARSSAQPRNTHHSSLNPRTFPVSLEHFSGLLFPSHTSTLDHGTISIGSLQGGPERIWSSAGAGQWSTSHNSVEDHPRTFLGRLNLTMGDALDDVTALFGGHGRETVGDWNQFTPVSESHAVFWGGALGLVSLVSARRLSRREA